MKSPEAQTIQILHVGADTELLWLRTAVLQRYWLVKSAGFQDALAALEQGRFDVILICHSVPEPARIEIEDFVAESSFPAVVLTLRQDLQEDQIVRTGLGLQISSGPSMLVHRIENVLHRAG
jgi:hypothetical protein